MSESLTSRSATCSSRSAVLSLFGTKDRFPGRQFFSLQDGGRWGGFRMIQSRYTYCVLCFYYYYISSTSDHPALDPPEVGDPCSSGLFAHFFRQDLLSTWASQMVLVVRDLPANAGDVDSILGSGRSPGGGHGNPLQYSCLENPMDRGVWWAAVLGVAKSRTQLK